MIELIDLKFQGYEGAIASYLIKTSDGPVLIETGPYSTIGAMKEALENNGYTLQDVKHVFLTHIHLDHAGSAWAFAENGAKIYVHPFGAKNMEDPSKLMSSATRIYGDQMDRLWGTMKNIPGDLLHEVQDEEEFQIGDVTIKGWYTPGHAKHHIAWQIGDNIFTGDVAGCKIGDGPVVPPCPPPDINLEDWKNSIQVLRNANPSKLYLTHFDAITNIDEHLNSLEEMLDDWANWIKKGWESGKTVQELTPEFSKYTTQQLLDLGVDDEGVKVYEAANPSWMSVAGLVRYWTKKAEQS